MVRLTTEGAIKGLATDQGTIVLPATPSPNCNPDQVVCVLFLLLFYFNSYLIMYILKHISN